MPKNITEIGGMLVVGLILAFVLYCRTGGGLGTLNGHAQVPTKGDWKLLRTEKEYDTHANVTVTVGHDRVVVPLWVRDNQLYADTEGLAPTTSGDPVSVSIDATRRRFGINPMFDRVDFGAWAGRSSIENADGNNFDVGVRWGVCRFFDDTLAVDVVGSDHEFGAGLSLHLPPDRFPGFWHHVGVGWARVVGFDHDGQGDVVALSFNTR